MQSIPMVFILGMVAVNVVQAVRVSPTMCFFPADPVPGSAGAKCVCVWHVRASTAPAPGTSEAPAHRG